MTFLIKLYFILMNQKINKTTKKPINCVTGRNNS